MVRRSQYAVLGMVCALVIGVYGWNAKSGYLELSSSSAENHYYNLLVQGFRAGQLNLKREAPPGLAQLLASHDPVTNSPAWTGQMQVIDLSYYRGYGKIH